MKKHIYRAVDVKALNLDELREIMLRQSHQILQPQ